MAFNRQVSKCVLQAEQVPISGFDDLSNSQHALLFSLNNKLRDLWAKTMQNEQLRTLFARLVLRCQWWAAYYDFVMAASQATLCRLLRSSNLLQPLLVNLTTVVQLLKPHMASMQLPEPVLCEMYGVAADEHLLQCITADLQSTKDLIKEVERQNRQLMSCTYQQQSYARHMRKLLSTRHVAGLLQAVVAKYQLTHLVPDGALFKGLQTLLAGVRTHGHLRFATFISAKNVGPAAGSVPPVAPSSSAPPTCPAPGAAEASAAEMSPKLPATELIAKDKLVPSLTGSLALITRKGATRVSLDSQVIDVLNVAEMDKAQDLDAPAQLNQDQGDLVVLKNAELRSIEGLGPVTPLFGNLWVDANPKLTSLRSLESLPSVSGDVILRNSGGMTSLGGLSSFHVVEGELGITSLPIATTRQLSKLTTAGNSRSLSALPKLEDLTGLSRLAQVPGDLHLYLLPKITANADLSSLAGLGTGNRSNAVCAAAGASISSSVRGSLARRLGSVCAALGECAPSATSECTITAGTLQPAGLDLCTTVPSVAGSLVLVTGIGATRHSQINKTVKNGVITADLSNVGPSAVSQQTRLILRGVAQHQEPTDVCRDGEASVIGKAHKAQSKDTTLPGSAMTNTPVDDLSDSDKDTKTSSNSITSWHRLFCRRVGKAIAAATGVAIANMLVKRHCARQRL